MVDLSSSLCDSLPDFPITQRAVTSLDVAIVEKSTMEKRGNFPADDDEGKSPFHHLVMTNIAKWKITMLLIGKHR